MTEESGDLTFFACLQETAFGFLSKDKTIPYAPNRWGIVIGPLSTTSTTAFNGILLGGASKFVQGRTWDTTCVDSAGAWIPGPGCGNNVGSFVVSFSGSTITTAFTMMSGNYLVDAGLNINCSSTVQPDGVGGMDVGTPKPIDCPST
jgi:hypothetical protein